MSGLLTLIQILIATGGLVFASSAPVWIPGAAIPGVTSMPSAYVDPGQSASSASSDELQVPTLLAGIGGDASPGSALPAQQTDDDEPLDENGDAEPLDDGEVEQLDGPVQRLDEPLDEPAAGTDDEEPLDAPIDSEPEEGSIAVEEPLDAPLAEAEPEPPVAGVEPLDAPLAEEVIDQPVAIVDPLDAPLAEEPVAVVPPAETPVSTAAAPVAVKPEPVPDSGKPVSSVRTKGEPSRQVIAVTGRSTIPVEIADCDVVVAAGRGTVGSDCPDADSVVTQSPTIPRQPGSSALITSDNPTVISSHRGGVQIGEYPEPTLGDSIATTVRAAIFPEDVVVPDVLIVPGEVVAAGNAAAEDPIILWRSELEAASAQTGVPVEILATAIRVTSNGDLNARTAAGGVGLMHVPVAALESRGLDTSQWYDPATNILVAAELMADGASPADVQSGAVLSHYLEVSCVARDTCAVPDTSDLRQWIVHYRLRVTTNGAGSQQAVVPTSRPENWPFDDAGDNDRNDPFAGRNARPNRDEQTERNRPTVRVGGNDADSPRPPATRNRIISD